MFPRTLVSRKASAVAVFMLLFSLFPLPHALAQQGKPSGFRQWLKGLNALAGGSVVGQWRGFKTENDPIHGGYLNLSFAFAFAADGTYQEAAYMGSQQVMFATGTYQQIGNGLSFAPQQCTFASPELAQVVRFFPIPIDGGAEDAFSLSPLQGGAQMSLKDAASGEDWGLKPAF